MQNNPKNPKKFPKNPKKSKNFSLIDQQNDQESIFFDIDSYSPYFFLLLLRSAKSTPFIYKIGRLRQNWIKKGNKCNQ
jgi:hypothetical protein